MKENEIRHKMKTSIKKTCLFGNQRSTTLKVKNMTRSLWKGPFCEVLTKNQKLWSRRSVILPYLVGKQIQIHNGKNFLTLKITDDMIGHKLGEFASTRKKAFHKKKTKK